MAEREAGGFLVRGADGRLFTVRSDDVQPVAEDDRHRVEELLNEAYRHPGALDQVNKELPGILGCIWFFQVVDAPWFRKGG
jgi:hypothetical protein